MSPRQIPSYDLYADARTYPVPGFLHAERIGVRSRPNDWRIRSHRHAAMWQAMLVVDGGGEGAIDGRRFKLAPPFLVWVPAGLVHAYDFEPETDGIVVTAARDLLEGLLAREGFGDCAFLAQRVLALSLDDPRHAKAIELHMSSILSELGLHGFGGRAAVCAHFELLLVAMARAAGEVGASRSRRADEELSQRFRALLEERFRDHWTLARYAEALGVTIDRLYAGVRSASGRSPQAVLHDRLMIEAKRGLLYTSMSVQEIAYGLGFEDPAYFTRFFVRRAGHTPTGFRVAEEKMA
ncbi:MAG: helix-turn-helix domain-containing protein [Beijerinckiaceae bacterium]